MKGAVSNFITQRRARSDFAPANHVTASRRLLHAAARPLAVQDRDPFLRAVAERLSSLPHLGDGLVFQICREVQREHWNAGGLAGF